MKGFKSLAPVDEAVASFLAKITHKPSAKRTPLGEALGRYLAEDVVAEVDVPPFDRAAFDGYAVRSEDTLSASRANPVVLRLAGRVLPGAPYSAELGPGEAVEAATGAPLPQGADAVVPYEEAEARGEYVEIYRPVPKYYYVSRRGEDVAKGELVLRAGTRLRPWDIGVLASLGVREVAVYDVKAALLSTGGELVDLEEAGSLRPGQIINSSRFVLCGLAQEAGASCRYLGIYPDDEAAIEEAVARAVEGHDMVVTTGGVSVGEPDRTFKAVAKLAEFAVHGVAVRPGRPNSAAVVGGKPVVMLSGFPVAASIGFEIFARPAMLKMVGAREEPRPAVKAVLTRRATTPINVRTYARVRVFRRGGRLYAEPLAVTGSGVLSTLTRGNGILVIPERREGFDEGEEVEVQLIRPVEDE